MGTDEGLKEQGMHHYHCGLAPHFARGIDILGSFSTRQPEICQMLL